MVQFYKNQYGMVVDASGNVVTDKAQLQQAGGMAQGTEAAKVAISKLPEFTPMTQGGAVNASGLSAPTSLNTPTPTAPRAAETFQVGLQAGIQSATTNLEKTLKQERDAALKRQEQLNKQLLAIQQESDPTKRATFAQEERIIQNQLDAAETASATLEEDFVKRRATVSELERLLTEGNDLIAKAKNAPVSLSVLNKSVNRTIQDVQARAGVLQAVIAGVDGNISMAHSLINTAQGTVRTYWSDEVSYNNAYLNLVANGQLAKNKINDDYAKSRVALAERKLNQLEETADYIKKLMIDPATAQFIADAGVTLNDSVEEINAKLAEQNRKNEVNDVINDLKLEGYKFVPFGEGRSDAVALEIAGETLYFVPPPSVLQSQAGKTGVSGGSGGGGGFFDDQGNEIDAFDAARLLAEANPNASENELVNAIRANVVDAKGKPLISVGDAQRIVREMKENTPKQTVTAEQVKTKVVETLRLNPDLTRKEARGMAETQLKKAVGDPLPKAYKDAIEDALVEVYGATFLQNLIPGGRGAFRDALPF